MTEVVKINALRICSRSLIGIVFVKIGNLGDWTYRIVEASFV